MAQDKLEGLGFEDIGEVPGALDQIAYRIALAEHKGRQLHRDRLAERGLLHMRLECR